MDSFFNDLFRDKAWHKVGMSKSKSVEKMKGNNSIINKYEQYILNHTVYVNGGQMTVGP